MPFLSKIRLNGTLYDLKVAGDAMVTGVKGDAESDYRVGDVNITPEDIGTISTQDTQSLTDTQKSTARDNLGLGSAATRSVPATGNANATQVVLGSDTRLTGSYKTDDSASTTINDTDYIPMSDSSGTKKKTLWSTIIAKVKSVLGKSDVGLGNVANLDQSKAIKSITRSGTTFTATALDGTTSTFTQQDNNTTYPIYDKRIDANYKTSYRTETKGDADNGAYISTLRNNTASVDSSPQFGSGMAWGAGDTQGYLYTAYNASEAYIGGGNGDKLNWVDRVYTTGYKPEAVRDIGNNTETKFAYSKAGMGYYDFSYLAGWNGYELRGVDKGLFAPKSHASTGTGYGAGNASNYGHVKLSDTYTSSVGGASSSIGASQSALYNVYSLLPRSYVYIDGANGSYIHTSGFPYYTITANVPKTGYYIAMFNFRCYGGSSQVFPEYINVYDSYSGMTNDPLAAIVAYKEYGWQTLTCILNLTSGSNKTIAYLRSYTKSANFNARTKLLLIYPT